jgi:hypothetical protein
MTDSPNFVLNSNGFVLRSRAKILHIGKIVILEVKPIPFLDRSVGKEKCL